MPRSQSTVTRRLNIIFKHMLPELGNHIKIIDLLSPHNQWLKYIPGCNIPDDWQPGCFHEVLENLATHLNNFLSSEKANGRIMDYMWEGSPNNKDYFSVRIIHKPSNFSLPPVRQMPNSYTTRINTHNYKTPLTKNSINNQISFFNHQTELRAKYELFETILHYMSINQGKPLKIVDDILLRKLPIQWKWHGILPTASESINDMSPYDIKKLIDDFAIFLKFAIQTKRISDYRFVGSFANHPNDFRLEIKFMEIPRLKPFL